MRQQAAGPDVKVERPELVRTNDLDVGWRLLRAPRALVWW
jgi:hypothetical protein